MTEINKIVEVVNDKLSTYEAVVIDENRIGFDLGCNFNDKNYEQIQMFTERVCYYIEEQEGVYFTDYEINVEGYSSIIEIGFD